MNKKGYFFIIDAFIASTIIVITLMLIINSDERVPVIQNKYFLAEEFATFIINTNVEDMNNPTVNSWINQTIVRNPKNSIMEQIAEFHFNANDTLATDLITITVNGTVGDKNGFSYRIDNVTLYSRNTTHPLEDSRLIVTSKKIVYWEKNSTTLYGPAIVEITVWI